MLNKYLRNRRILIALIVAAIVSLPAFSALFILIDSPSSCNLCHQMKKEYSTWMKSPHKKASCTDCHQPTGRSGWLVFKLKRYQMIVSYTLNNYKQPITTEVNNDNCLPCHQDVQEKTLISRTIRVSHKEFLQQGNHCTKCHNTIAHQKQVPRKNYPYMEKCTSCHNGDQVSKDCSLCHTKQESSKPRHGMGPWAVTHSDKWAKTHGMGNLTTCIVCHPEDYCIRCHKIKLPHPGELWQAKHGKSAISMPDVCNSCHFPNYCTSCHQIAMPHPDNWLPIHSKERKKLGKKNCMRCHVERDCDDCHERHIHRAVKHKRVSH